MKIDFLPETYRQRRNVRYIRRVCVLTGLCLSIVAVAWGLVQFNQATRLAARADALASQAEAAQRMQTELVRMTEEHRRLKRQARIGRELSMPLEQAELVRLLDEVLPAQVAITHLEVVTRRPTPEAMEQAGDTKKNKAKADDKKPGASEPNRLEIEIAGIAPSDLVVAEVVNDLTEHPIFSHVTLHGSRPVKRFGYHVRLFDLSLRAPLNRRFVRAEPGDAAEAEVEGTDAPSGHAQSAVEVTP